MLSDTIDVQDEATVLRVTNDYYAELIRIKFQSKGADYRALAIALAFVVTVGVVAIGALRPSLIEATRTMSSLLPSTLQGTFVFETPLGGALRGDFVIASIVLFVSDWLLVRCAHRLRPA